MKLSSVSWIASVLAGAALVAAAHAADPVKNYPLRPVRIVSPFAVGGNSDIVGRLLAPRLAERLGQNFIVENRPGAGGITGTSYVARATPDGHTLLIASGAFTSVAAVTKKLPYDALRDFSWISMVVAYPFVVVVKADAPMRTVEDLIAAAKRTPGKLIYGSVGTGSVFHLAAEMFSTMTGTEMLHVPYKGGAEPVTELIGGRIHVIFTTLTGAVPHIEAKRLRALAVTSLTPAAKLPGVPMMAQTLPGYEVTSFVGLAVPQAVPRPVVTRLNRELHAALKMPDVSGRLADLGGEVRPTTPEAMHKHVTDEIAKWRRIVEVRKIDIQ